MFQSSTIEISKSALKANLDFIRGKLKKNVRLSSVVKGKAYGHTIETFVPLAEEFGVDHFSVHSAEEALAVFEFGKRKPTIMIMGSVEESEIEWAIENEIEFYVFEKERLECAVNHSKKINKKARIHIEIETGMNRTGFDKPDLIKAVSYINKNKENISVQGICTHYAGAESITNYYRIQKQHKIFRETIKWLKAEGINPKYKHSASSAATFRYPNMQMNMVRVGILQYGFWPSPETFIEYIGDKEDKRDPLKRILSWKTKVMDTKEVKAGEFVGYGTSFLAVEKMKIATFPVGYSHGFSRSLSNQGRVLINGKRVGVIGTVNMNMTIVDISRIPETKKGDEVVIIGKQGELSISVASFGEMSDQMNYELLTRLPVSIPRVIVE